MKFYDMLKISIKEFLKNKSNYLNIVFIAISASLVMFCLSFSKSLDNYWNQSIKKMVDYRTFFVYYDQEERTKNEALNLLKSYKNIESISPYTSYIINMRMFDKINNNKETNMFLFGIPKNSIATTHGKSIDDYNSNEKVMVCPEEIFYETKDDNKLHKKSLNLVNSIGKTFPLKFIDEDNKIENFKLVGTYDSSTRQGKDNFCYTNSEVVEKLNLYYQPEAFEEAEGLLYPLIVRFKHNVNIKEAVQQLEKDKFYTNGDPVVKIDTTLGDKVLNLVSLISFLIIIFSIIINILIFIKNKRKQQKKYAILKTLGYKQSDNIKLQCIESLFCLGTTILLMLFINTVITFTFQNYFIKNEAMLYGLKLSFSNLSICIGILFCLLSYIALICIHNNSTKKYNIMEAIDN